jgi:hypothetical protein
MALMEHQNPLMKLVFLSKLKKMIHSYRGNRLDEIDKRLLRGLFLKNIRDFDEEQKSKTDG